MKRRNVLLGGLSFAMAPYLGFASCPEPTLKKATELPVYTDSLMLITHASATYDARYSTKPGLDVAIRKAKEKGIPVISLVDDSPIRDYMMADCVLNHWVYSKDGEIEFAVRASEIFVAGGHLELCLSRTLHDVIYQLSKNPKRYTTITYLMDAVYSNGKHIEPSDPFFNDFAFFMNVVTYGRPGGEWWPKLNLLETTGIIRRIEDDYRYFEKVLPRWDRTFDESWRIELQFNDFETRVLQKGSGFSSPAIKFKFIDSAELIS